AAKRPGRGAEDAASPATRASKRTRWKPSAFSFHPPHSALITHHSSLINYQSSIINHQLSIINYQLSPIPSRSLVHRAPETQGRDGVIGLEAGAEGPAHVGRIAGSGGHARAAAAAEQAFVGLVGAAAAVHARAGPRVVVGCPFPDDAVQIAHAVGVARPLAESRGTFGSRARIPGEDGALVCRRLDALRPHPGHQLPFRRGRKTFSL